MNVVKMEGEVELVREVGGELRIGVGVILTHVVVDVGDVEVELVMLLLGECVQSVSECDGIGAC